MEVSPRARLAWANRNIEAAADIIVADYLRAKSDAAPELKGQYVWNLDTIADGLDPEGATA